MPAANEYLGIARILFNGFELSIKYMEAIWSDIRLRASALQVDNSLNRF